MSRSVRANVHGRRDGWHGSTGGKKHTGGDTRRRAKRRRHKGERQARRYTTRRELREVRA